MTDVERLSEARNAALQKIGRNVYLFQRMEGMLKFLDSISRYKVSAEDIESFRNGGKPAVPESRLSMGLAAKSALNKLYAPEDPDEETDLSGEVRMSWSVRLEATNELIENHRKEIKSVVDERNWLIHTRLLAVTPDSIESWLTLGRELDEQKERIRPELENLQRMVSSVREHLGEVAKIIDSDEFLQILKTQRLGGMS